MANSIAATASEQKTIQLDLSTKQQLIDSTANLNKQTSPADLLGLKPEDFSKEVWSKLSAKISSAITELVDSLAGLIGKKSSKQSKLGLTAEKTTSKKSAKKTKSKLVKTATKKSEASAASTNSTAAKNSSSVTDEQVKASAAAPNSDSNGSLSTQSNPNTTISPNSVQTKSDSTLLADNSNEDSLYVHANDDGTQSIYTEDGYVIKTEGKDQAWTITDQEGKVTRIWGDPHVLESDGDKWDFKDRSSFLFGNNKVTIETAPAGVEQTYTSKITAYNANARATLGGIDKDKPTLEILKHDGVLDDSIREDGDVFILTKETKGDDKFVLLKDVGGQFDPKFASKVAVGEKLIFDKLLTEEQKQMLGRN